MLLLPCLYALFMMFIFLSTSFMMLMFVCIQNQRMVQGNSHTYTNALDCLLIVSIT